MNIRPTDIEFLIHCHYLREPHRGITDRAPGFLEACEKLQEAGIIKPAQGEDTRCFQTTELGRKWVALLCTIQPPKDEKSGACYMVVCARDIGVLEENVESYLAEGWELQGGENWAQAMTSRP